METPHVRLGIIGAGFVGRAFVQMLGDDSRQIALVDGATAVLEVVGVAVRDATTPREGIDSALLVEDPMALAAREDVDILVELAGGVEPARSWIEIALRRGASVVTANKTLMAAHGTELAQLAHDNGADLLYDPVM